MKPTKRVSKRVSMAKENWAGLVDSDLTELTLWEKAMCVMQTPDSGSGEVVDVVSQFLSVSGHEIDKISCTNIVAWHQVSLF